ncbi:MAG: outer membrane lipoprotein-sorting protein [Chitinivibrionales bacterium]|nr:outer membrane lipoprotein-sorting protein [Chitinivibrionales bacterium]
MKSLTCIFGCLSLLFFLFMSSTTAAPIPAAEQIMKTIEENETISTDASAIVQITQQKTDEGTKVFQIMWYRRDRDNSFLFHFLSPEAEKGNGYLYIEDNFWMYRKNTRTFQHINRDESIGGTDAQAGDFEVKKFTQRFQPLPDSTVVEEKLGQIPVYRFHLIAKINDVDYPKKTYWVRRDNLLVLKNQSFSTNNTLMETIYYLNYTEILKKYVAVKTIVVNEFEKGNKTILEISGIKTDKLDDGIFTKAYLENLSK